MTVTAAAADHAFEALDRHLAREGYRGWEFDDLLASPVVRALCGSNLFLQRCAVQLGRLSPINLRTVLGVPKLESAKARGFFARGYLHRYAATREPRWLKKAQDMLDWVLGNPSPSRAGLAWGNHFDFASRGGFFPTHLPTVVWTAHIADALDLAYEFTEDTRYQQALRATCEFVLTLERTSSSDGVCIAYAPGIPALIHNSNLLGAQTLLRGWRHFSDERYAAVAQAAYAWTLRHQNADGSWFYGVGDKYRWVDNFHTAYVLDSLVLARDITGGAVVSDAVIARTFAHWIARFFGVDGEAKYYEHGGPRDIQCAAQAVETLSGSCASFDGAPELSDRVLQWTIHRFQKPNGAFRFRLGRWLNNDLESIHWGQSTMLSALGRYLRTAAPRLTPERLGMKSA